MKTAAFIIISIIIQILTICVAVYQGQGDAIRYGNINHNKNVLIRLAMAIPTSIVFNFAFEFWFDSWRIASAYVVPSIASVFLIFVMGFIYWIWFEFAYNIQRKKDPLYIGNTAILDQLARRIFSNGKQLILVKLLGLTISEVIFYGWIFHKG